MDLISKLANFLTSNYKIMKTASFEPQINKIKWLNAECFAEFAAKVYCAIITHTRKLLLC